MKNKKNKLSGRFSQISSDIKQYIEKRLELTLLNTGEHVAGWMAASIQRAAGAVLLLLGVSFLLVALAIYLGNLLDSRSLGYVAVGGFLLLAGILFLYLMPRSIFKHFKGIFEAEVIKAIKEDEIPERKQLESTETKRSKKKKEH